MMVSGMKPQYGDKIRMAFTGTDSFVFYAKLMIYIYIYDIYIYLSRFERDK